MRGRPSSPAATPAATTSEAPGGLNPRARDSGTLLPVRVTPRAARAGLDGIGAGALRVRLTAPPVEGAANAALLAVLADALDVPRSRLTLVSGARARQKTVLVDGLAPDEVVARVDRALGRAAT